MVEQRRHVRGWHEYFSGYRVNCESVPRLPASAVRWMIEDPRKIPYLLVWRWRNEESTEEAVRLSVSETSGDRVDMKRVNGSWQATKTIWRQLPRNGGRALLLVCPGCESPHRYLYGWRLWPPSVLRCSWICRYCAGLRYCSEGAYLSSRMRSMGGYPRTPPWDPWVFSSPPQLV